MFTAQSCTAVVYWFSDLLKDRFKIRWNRHAEIDSSSILPYVVSPLISAILLSSISTLISLVTFAILRMAVLPLVYRLPIVHGFLRCVKHLQHISAKLLMPVDKTFRCSLSSAKIHCDIPMV